MRRPDPCPEHSYLPKTNANFCRLKLRGMARRDRDTDAQLAAVGWLAVRIWEHEDPGEVAQAIDNSCATELSRSSRAGLV
jgi:DNA mismatch endonuclease (patch repair protein)